MKTPVWEISPGAALGLLFPGLATGAGSGAIGGFEIGVSAIGGGTGRASTFAAWDLYTIQCAQGPTLRYTTCDRDVGYGGTTWESGTVRIEPADQRNALAHWKIGLDVDTWQAVFFPRPVDDVTGATYPDQIGSQPWLAAAAAGALDGAIVTVDRAHFALPITAPQAAPITPTGVWRIFAGRVAEVDMGRTGACVSVNSHLELLNVQMPRRLFQAGCVHMLFDQGCTLSASAYAVSGTVGGGSTRSNIISSIGAPAGSGTYTYGRLSFTSGQNAGFQRSVRSWDGVENFQLVVPLPFPVATGDAFTAYPGCDKQLSTCQAFSNQPNFGGQPYIPAPETAA